MKNNVGFFLLFAQLSILGMEKPNETKMEPSRCSSLVRNGLSRQLLAAVRGQDQDKVKAVLKQYPLVDVHFFSDTQDSTGFEETILLSAITDPKERYNHQVLQMLLAYEPKPNINLASKNGLTPLLKSILFGNEEAALALIEADADVHPKITIRQHPVDALQLAQQMRMEKIVSAIIKKQPDILVKKLTIKSPRELTQKN